MSSLTSYFNLLNEEKMITTRLNEIKREKREISKKVWKECIHDWERCSDYDDLCKFKCKKCTLYNSHYLYS